MCCLGFWIFLPLGGAVLATTLPIPIPEQSTKPQFREACTGLYKKLDVTGFMIFAGVTAMLLQALTWGGGQFAWSSPTIIGLLCGTVGLTAVFAFWIKRCGTDALIPPSTLCRQEVAVGSIVMFLQGGATQMIPYFLPFWFQAIRGDSPVTSAVHLLPSLISNIVALIVFGALGKSCRPCATAHDITLILRHHSPQVSLHPSLGNVRKRTGERRIWPPHYTRPGNDNRSMDRLPDCHDDWTGYGLSGGTYAKRPNPLRGLT